MQLYSLTIGKINLWRLSVREAHLDAIIYDRGFCSIISGLEYPLK